MPTTSPRVAPPIPATCVIADLRNFTPNLNAADIDGDGVNQFCYFVSEMYSLCLECIDRAIPPGSRSAPPVRVTSTGDGVLAVFTGPRHHCDGYLAALLMNATLGPRCDRFNAGSDGRAPATSFGIGVESGAVSSVSGGAGPLQVETLIGHCVNIAARTEGVTKALADARTLFADSVVEAVANEVFGECFETLRAAERELDSWTERVALHDRMHELNRKMCITYLNRHVLKGVAEPVPLYRVRRSVAHLGQAPFEVLLDGLIQRDPDHRREIEQLLGSPPERA